jgi:hypothetical protein
MEKTIRINRVKEPAPLLARVEPAVLCLRQTLKFILYKLFGYTLRIMRYKA